MSRLFSGLPPYLPPDESRSGRVFETSFFGVVTVTDELLPLLRRSTAGRIVIVSSGLLRRRTLP
jgi:NAD(P)-dependent dehydrogenase (short-subunit alcohol dehydrogenase family)